VADNRHGYDFQDDFENRWTAMGKTAWLYRFKDASDLYGRNKRLVKTDPQPADFLCGYSGWLGLVECKATKSELGFPIRMIEQAQLNAAKRSIAANTPYYFAIKSELHKQWFFTPAGFILSHTGTVRWSSLTPYQWIENQLVTTHHAGY